VKQVQSIALHCSDNIVIVVRAVAAGDAVVIDGEPVCAKSAIAIGHKVARYNMAEGTKILRYGAPIGTLTEGVSKGDHVHLNNLKSDYIATHDRETVTSAAND